MRARVRICLFLLMKGDVVISVLKMGKVVPVVSEFVLLHSGHTMKCFNQY